MRPLSARAWLAYLGINVLVSAITTLIVLRAAAAPASPSAPTPIPTQANAVPIQIRPTFTPTPIPPTPTRVAPAAGKVTISGVNNVGQRQREQVVISNQGDLVDLKGWTLSSGRGYTYTFASASLFKDTFININTTVGSDTQINVFWGRQDAAWQVGDTVELRDVEGLRVDNFVIR